MTEHARLRKYWMDQVKTGRGGGMVVYKGSRFQKGHGLASILGNFGKSPIFRKGLAYAAKAALNTGGDIISNLASGQNFKTAAKAGFSRQRNIQRAKAVNAIKNMVRPRQPGRVKRRQPGRVKRRKLGVRPADNFGSLRR